MSKTELIGASIRSIAASIPVAASFAQAWSEYKNHKEKSRVESFMNEFGSYIKTINTDGKEIALCESAPELLEKCVDSAIKEPSGAKRSLMAQLASKIVINSDALSYEDKVQHIQLVEFLNESDIDNLRLFYPNKNIRVENIDGYQDLYSEDKKEKFGKLIFSLCKLESRGLIGESNDNQMHTTWTGDIDHWQNRWKFKHFEILPIGRKLLEILDNKA